MAYTAGERRDCLSFLDCVENNTPHQDSKLLAQHPAFLESEGARLKCVAPRGQLTDLDCPCTRPPLGLVFLGCKAGPADEPALKGGCGDSRRCSPGTGEGRGLGVHLPGAQAVVAPAAARLC